MLVVVSWGHNFAVRIVVFDGAWTKFVAEGAPGVVVSKETRWLGRQVPQKWPCVRGLPKTFLRELSFRECSSYQSTWKIIESHLSPLIRITPFTTGKPCRCDFLVSFNVQSGLHDSVLHAHCIRRCWLQSWPRVVVGLVYGTWQISHCVKRRTQVCSCVASSAFVCPRLDVLLQSYAADSSWFIPARTIVISLIWRKLNKCDPKQSSKLSRVYATLYMTLQHSNYISSREMMRGTAAESIWLGQWRCVVVAPAGIYSRLTCACWQFVPLTNVISSVVYGVATLPLQSQKVWANW